MGWFDEQIRQRKSADDEVLSDSFARMAASVLGKKDIIELDNKRIITKEAVDEILKFYHCKSQGLDDDIKDRDEELEYLLRPHGIMHRDINLKDNWYKDSFGAILAFEKENGNPVALLPSGLSGYSYKNSINGKKIKINKNNANLFQENAICFYRPLPLRKLDLKDILYYIKNSVELRDVFLTVLAASAVTVLGMLTTQLARIMTGTVLQNGDINMLAGLLFFMLCSAGASSLINSVSMLLTNRISTKISIYLEAAIMMRILSLPSNFFRKYNSGNLAKRVQMVKSLCTLLLNTVFSVLLSAVLSFLYLGQFSFFAGELVVPSSIIIISMIFITAVTVIFRIKQTKQIMDFSVKESGMSISLISGIQKIRLCGAEKRAFAKWAEIFSKQTKLTYNPSIFLKLNGGMPILTSKKQKAKNFMFSTQTFLTALVILSGNIFIYYAAARNGMKQNDYFAFNMAFGIIMGIFNSLTSASKEIAQITPILSMLKPILTAVPELSENKKVLSKLSGNIELNNVCFRYNENMPNIIDNISLKIRRGEYIAVVGKTGCGKSTLMRLLLGFEKPDKGAIYYDGKDINSLDLKALRRMIGAVTQDGGLFQGDIYSNIIISAPQLTVKDAWEAAELAGIADDIRAMPLGMHTLISEGGGGISGGQKQRLMIARAIVHKPKILMFDEATSALDNITQKIVSESLDSLKCTRIIIAHRLSTIQNCDRILVLDSGKIIEEGNYETLMKKRGFFASLVEHQQI